MLTKINVKINPKPANKYNIFLGCGIVDNHIEWLPPLDKCSKVVVITDKLLENLHAKKFTQMIEKLGYTVLLLSVNPGEESKSLAVKESIELEMLKNKCDRRTLLIAFGGGVIGDLTGFIAATYMRGINYIQIPTTLLSVLDSSVGGKTGINTIYGKNLIGSIWQPIAVVTDTNLLTTLPQIQLINGLIEAIKIFLTLDQKSFYYLVKNLKKVLDRDEKILQSIIKRAVKLKAYVVKTDEREENLRMILNFGHTVGHAIEKLSDYTILHGLCVALGIIVEAKIAVLMGHLTDNDFNIITELLSKLGITREMLLKFNVDEIVANMLIDKKNKDGSIYAVILKNIGSVYTVNDRVVSIIDSEIVKQAFSSFRN